MVGSVLPMATAHDTGERHLVHRSQWLRAAVLGANDGIVSTASLVLGVAAAGSSRNAIVTAGIAGLVAGAMSMAAGEYVSVNSQRDTEAADLERERRELERNPEGELEELQMMFVERGVRPEVAAEVARDLSRKDALGAHAQEELGIDPDGLANPFQAAWASALSFSVGAVVPLLAIALTPSGWRVPAAIIATVIALFVLGVTGARIGGAPWPRPATRVVVWGIAAMAITMGIGALVGTAV